MGQYHYPVNLDRREFIHPHKLGTGLKMWEQVANAPGTGAALLILLAHPVNRGGGDLGEHEAVGRWRGDRIAMIGDYAQDGDLQGKSPVPENTIYSACSSGDDGDASTVGAWTDISDMVCAAIEAELGGKFTGDGWREWKENDASKPEQPAQAPDMILKF